MTAIKNAKHPIRIIRWTTAERDKVIFKAGELLDAKEVRGWRTAMLEAQKLVLSDEKRHRPSLSLGTDTALFRNRYHALLAIQAQEEERKEAEDAARKEAEDAALHKTERKAAETQALVDEQKALLKEQQGSVVPVHVAASFENHDFITNAITQIADRFKEALIAELKRAVMQSIDEIGKSAVDQISAFRTTPIERKPLPKIVICGVRPSQSGRLKTDFGNLCRLTIIEERQSPIRLKNSAVNADYVIINTEYCGHDYLDQVKQHPGLKRITGGNESFDVALLEILTR